MFLCLSDVKKSLVLFMMTAVSGNSRPLCSVVTVTRRQLCWPWSCPDGRRPPLPLAPLSSLPAPAPHSPCELPRRVLSRGWICLSLSGSSFPQNPAGLACFRLVLREAPAGRGCPFSLPPRHCRVCPVCFIHLSLLSEMISSVSSVGAGTL